MSPNSQKVSIILPFKNSAKTMQSCISSIKAQSLKDWELIAVNDHSNDDSFSRSSSILAKDKRIRILQNDGEGLVDAINFGIKRSSSQIIARMDADDRMHPDRLRLQIEYLEKNFDVGLVSSLVRHVKIGNHNTNGFQSYVDWINQTISFKDILMNRFTESPLAHPSIMIRKELFFKFGFYKNGDFPEDYELWLRLLEKGIRFEKLNKYLLEWNDSETRLSRNDKRYKLSSFQILKAHYLKKWLFSNIHKDIPIHAWGYGKFAKQQARYLLDEGIEITCIYEIDKKKINKSKLSIPVVHFQTVPKPGRCFILVLIGKGKVRGKISNFLKSKGYVIGINFLHVA
jgi:glycosyltransferase involved in cell wall biosynthesis